MGDLRDRAPTTLPHHKEFEPTERKMQEEEEGEDDLLSAFAGPLALYRELAERSRRRVSARWYMEQCCAGDHDLDRPAAQFPAEKPQLCLEAPPASGEQVRRCMRRLISSDARCAA